VTIVILRRSTTGTSLSAARAGDTKRVSGALSKTVLPRTSPERMKRRRVKS
jgi:hypothetical protein